MDAESTPSWCGGRVSFPSTRDPGLIEEIIACLKRDWMLFVYESEGIKPSFDQSLGPENDPLFITVENTIRDIDSLWPDNNLPYLTLTWRDPSDPKSYVFFYSDDGGETWNRLIQKLAELQALQAKNRLQEIANQVVDPKKKKA